MNKNIDFKIIYLDRVDSTNTYLKELALKGAEEGTVVVASHQTNGRGRMGRSFFSPEATGLYMSILLKPQIAAEEAVKVTAAVAVAVSKAIDKVTGRNTKIKWVNDIYLEGLKVCGILTEAGFSGNSKSLDYVIVGIGINILPPENGFPNDIKYKAGTICENATPGIKEELLNTILLYLKDTDNFQEEYKARSCVIGKQVTVIQGNNSYPAKVLDIAPDCSLKILLGNHTVKYLSSGEISLQGDFT